MPVIQLLTLLAATLSAGFIKGAAGMGAGIFLQPVLTLIFDPLFALGITGPIILFTDMATLIAYWRAWASFHVMAILVGGCLLGTLIGVLALPHVTASAMKLIVGICGIAFVIGKLLKLPSGNAKRVSVHMLLLAATAGGFFNTVANAGGIFFAWCGMRLNLPPRVFVASLVLVIFINSVMKVSGYLSIGILSTRSLLWCLALAPVAMGGAWLGSRFNRHLKQGMFGYIVLAIIGIVSLSSLFSLIN